MFTRLDRNLLVRVGQQLLSDAALEEHSHGKPSGWAATADGREAKRRFDRILRDRRDLEALRRRLEQAYPESLKIPPALLAQPAANEPGPKAGEQ